MATHTTRWGILATGGIAQTFTKDLLVDPKTRNVSNIVHRVVAAASSTSQSRAQQFLKDVGAPSSAKAYGSYRDLITDPDVDVIYVATPHSHHFQNTMLCLQAGKNVLVEKPATVNVSQLKALLEVAREKNVFFMEAVWTRYFPLSIAVRKAVTDKAVGKIKRVTADLSMTEPGKDGRLAWDDTHRLVNPDLAGGALLDVGIYALTWNFQILYHLQEGAEKEKPKIVSALNKYDTGADEETAIILQFPKHANMGIATTSLRTRTYATGFGDSEAMLQIGPSIRIFGETGEIQVFGPPFRPQAYRIVTTEGVGEIKKCEIPGGHGMFWEADEVALCLRDGKKESAGMPWEESMAVLEAMDEVRRQNGLVYPDAVETSVYEETGEMNGKKA